MENDECQNAAELFPLVDNSTTVIVASTVDAQPTRNGRYQNAPVVYYTFEGDGKRVHLSTCTPETNYNTALYARRGRWCNNNGGFPYEWSSDEDLPCDRSGNAATLEFFAHNGDTYYVAVAGKDEEDSGTFGLSLFHVVQNDN